MKKINFLLVLILVLIVSGGWLQKSLRREPPPSVPAISQVTLLLDFGEGEMATFSGIRAKTAFEALEIVAQKENFEIETKEYDFGVLVQAIQGKENTQDQAWLYYVNSQMADKAADKFELKDQDQVLWKYEKPKF